MMLMVRNDVLVCVVARRQMPKTKDTASTSLDVVTFSTPRRERL